VTNGDVPILSPFLFLLSLTGGSAAQQRLGSHTMTLSLIYDSIYEKILLKKWL
jgi:hypothetical protein